MRVYRAILWGTGVLGSQVVRVISRKNSVRLVGGIVHSAEKVGKDLGRISGLAEDLGVRGSDRAEEVLKEVSADVVLICTPASKFFRGSYDENLEQILMALESKKNVITTTGFMYPWRTIPDIAKRIHEAAERNEVTFLGTGLNPGFLSDALLLFLTGPLVRVDRIKISDVEDLTLYNSVSILRDMLGYGLSPQQFEKEARPRFVSFMHDLYAECIHFLGDALGTGPLEVCSTLESFVAQKRLKTICAEIDPGTIASHLFVAEGSRDGRPFITVAYGAKVCPDEVIEGGPIGQTIEIRGRPSIGFRLEGDLVKRGILSTAAHLINAIPHVVAAPPGVTTRRDLPVFCPVP
jgi:hypothetical protein